VGGLIILVLIFAALWLVFLVPARRRRASHAAMQSSLEIGDEIITAGGLHGVIRELGDELRVELAPDVVVTLDRRAVAAVARDVEVEVEPPPETESGPAPEEGHEAG
jgi:preprotein translocase subunit YajC